MVREDKKIKVEDIKSIFSEETDIIFTDHSGVNSENTYDIRNKLADIDAKIKIIKNTLALIAANQVYSELDLSEILTGPTSIISARDIAAAAKLAKSFTRNFETFKIKAGIIDGKLYDSENINKLASLPSKEILIAQLLGLLLNPLTGLVTVLSGVPKNLVVVLDAIKKQKEQTGVQA